MYHNKIRVAIIKLIEMTDLYVEDEPMIYTAFRGSSMSAKEREGVYPEVPIGSDIRLLLEKKGILLCEYPYPDSEGNHTYGNITRFKTEDGTITFIGLNTSSY